MMGALDMMLKVLTESGVQLIAICIRENEWIFVVV
jgi:hypothetical protein